MKARRKGPANIAPLLLELWSRVYVVFSNNPIDAVDNCAPLSGRAVISNVGAKFLLQSLADSETMCRL
jgi:hypothetical protein